MRNLKKILALALALVMTLSLMTTANAFSDDKDFTAEYTEAATVLSSLGVIKGYTDGSFAPKASITRAEVAAIIYRVVTGDVTDKSVSIHAAYNKFKDVPSTHWAAGYIGYCANAELVKGNGDGTFDPEGKVTGYQALAMILRAVGYDANGEFTGSGWEVKVASTATQLGMLKNITTSLGAAAPREVVAEIIFQAIVRAYKVSYTPALGYRPITLPVVYPYSTNDMNTLGFATFGLISVADTENVDAWGRPGSVWYYKATTNNLSAKATGKKLCTIKTAPIKTYAVPVTQCDVATDLKLAASKTFDTYTNGVANKTVNGQTINPIATTATIGAQGRLTEVYADRIVYVDTYLAQVKAVANATYDAAGHMKSAATLYLEVFDKTGAAGTMVYLTSYTANYTYAAGQILLVNAANTSAVVDTVAVYPNAATTPVKPLGLTNYSVPVAVEIVGAAQSTTGAQTIIWQNQAKHTVGGTTYADNLQYHHDAAGKTANKAFTWFFDQYGNLLGSFDIAAVYSYAVIKDIQWSNPLGAYGSAIATLVGMDGQTSTKTVTAINGNKVSYTLFKGNLATGAVSANYGYNGEYIGEELYQVAEAADGTVTLTAVTSKLTGVNMTKGIPAITDGSSYLYVDDATQYLVRTGTKTVDTATGLYYTTYTWNVVTGYNQITSLQNATVYGVQNAGNMACKYVYVYGNAAAAASEKIVYVKSLAYAYAPAGADPTYVTLKDAYVAGVLTDVVVPAVWVDGNAANGEFVAGRAYYAFDANGNGYYEATELVLELNETAGHSEVTCANGVTKVNFLKAGTYTLLTNAIQINGTSVQFNTLGSATFHGDLTNLVDKDLIIVSNYGAAFAIYVIDTMA